MPRFYSAQYPRAIKGDEYYGPICQRCKGRKSLQSVHCRNCYTATRSRPAIQWIGAGERRLVARALKNGGFSIRHIATLLGVSPTTVSKDLAG